MTGRQWYYRGRKPWMDHWGHSDSPLDPPSTSLCPAGALALSLAMKEDSLALIEIDATKCRRDGICAWPVRSE